jgi:hypothetical protein
MPARPAGINNRAIHPPPSSGRSVAKEALVRQRPKIWFDHIIDLPPCQENFGRIKIFLILPKERGWPKNGGTGGKDGMGKGIYSAHICENLRPNIFLMRLKPPGRPPSPEDSLTVSRRIHARGSPHFP